MDFDGARYEGRIGREAAPCGHYGPGTRVGGTAGRRAPARLSPRLAGALDAIEGDGTPADRRGPIPFDGPDRLAYWRGKREAERSPGHAVRAPGVRPPCGQGQAHDAGSGTGTGAGARLAERPPAPVERSVAAAGGVAAGGATCGGGRGRGLRGGRGVEALDRGGR